MDAGRTCSRGGSDRDPTPVTHGGGAERDRADEGPALSDAPVRERLLVAAVIGGTAVAVLSEMLSAVGGLTRAAAAASWLIVLIVAIALVARFRRVILPSGPRPPAAPWRALDVAMLAWVVVVALLTLVSALAAAPTTYDSLTYHLARVAHWAQNHTLAPYPTSSARQLYQPPWAELAALHLTLLADGDRLVNLVQWASMIGAVVGASVIACRLGAARRGQLLAAAVCATIPMGVVQASSTQNDYAAALWLVCLVVGLLHVGSAHRRAWVLVAGLALGLALLTKGTAYVFAAPFVAWAALAGRGRPSTRLAAIVGMGLVAGALNAPHFARNVAVFGAPLGPGGEGDYTYTNRELSPAVLASNVARNVGLHAGTPWPAVNAVVQGIVASVDASVGIASDDPRSTWPGTRFSVGTPRLHEDVVGNGLHLVAIAAALLAALAWGDRRRRGYAACLALAFLLFCLLLRWQPWHSRLHLPLFVLAAPLVGVVAERIGAIAVAIVFAVLAAASVGPSIQNVNRPLVGSASVLRVTRERQFARVVEPAFLGAARFVRSGGCAGVGVVLGPNEPEYALWAMIPEIRRSGRLEHVEIERSDYGLFGSDRPGASGGFEPCAIVRSAASRRDTVSRGGRVYREAWRQDAVQVLVPDAPR